MIKLNLIPEFRKKEIAQASKLSLILGWEIEIFLIMLVFFALIVSLNYVLQFNLAAVNGATESQQSKDKYERISELDSEFKNINGQISQIESVQKDQLYWSTMFEKLSLAMPDGIKISKMANKNYAVFLAGVADTRDNLVALKDKLSQESCFTNVNLPLSNLVSRDNVDFQIDFNIKEECLKNK